MNKTIKLILMLIGFVITGSASAMKLNFALQNKIGDTQDKKFKLTTFKLGTPAGAKRERSPQDVIAQPSAPKKQNMSLETTERYFATRTPRDPVWINRFYQGLYNAIEYGDTAKAKKFQDFIGNFNELIGPVNMTLLHRAALRGSVEIAKLLLDGGAQINIPMANGKTALHIAAERGHLAMVQFLIESGADISASTTIGETPKALAIASMHIGVVAYFNALETYLAKEARNIEKQQPMVHVESRESILTSSGNTEIATDVDEAIQELDSVAIEIEEDIAAEALLALKWQ